MKKLSGLILCLLLFSCDKDDAINCDCTNNPQENLPWLKELIKKAESDKTGNYWGDIWLENYDGQEIFVTNMMLGSGGVLYYFFDCYGNHLISRNGEGYCPKEFVGDHHFFLKNEENFESFILNMKLDVVVYSKFP
ncbi:MAG: hypothetical protein LBV47_07920 [Bacteroidales bacterium]|jgi:hypothetical protein|nr:hypothetical protein [Bacteroidales bacterium]